jgi:hypothetical protein
MPISTDYCRGNIKFASRESLLNDVEREGNDFSDCKIWQCDRCSAWHLRLFKDLPLELPEENWWQDIENKQYLPAAVRDLLKGLISSVLHNAIPPAATTHLIQLANIYLKYGVYLGTQYYSVMVADPMDRRTYRPLFRLVENTTDTRLCHIDEVR